MTRHEGYFKGRDGTGLHYQTWEVEDPRAIVLVTHGQGEHSECYQRVADALNPKGLSVFAWDLRGHGRSEGKRGYVDDFGDYVSDLHLFVKQMEPRIAGRPFYLLGHSMGGLITLRSVVSSGPLGARAVLLSSPLLGLAIAVPPAKQKVARFTSKWMPKLTLHNEIKNTWLTHDKDILREYETDTYRHQKISSRVFLGFMEAIDYTLGNAEKLAAPMFMQLSGEDKVVSTPASKEFFEHVTSSKELKVYDGSYHEIYNDVEREQVFADLNDYIDRDLAK